jgi:hypothetical protein
VVLLRALLGRRLPFATGTPVVAALLITVLVVPSVWGAVRGLGAVRDGLVLAPGTGEREKCLIDGGRSQMVEASRWLQARIPSDARISLSGPAPRVCLQLSLLPRLFVHSSEPHDFSVYYRTEPPEDATGTVERLGEFVLVREG